MPYTFQKNKDGNVEVFQNGQRFTTTSEANAANTYGYTAPQTTSAQNTKTVASPYFSSADGATLIDQTKTRQQSLLGTPQTPAPNNQTVKTDSATTTATDPNKPKTTDLSISTDKQGVPFSREEALKVFGTDFSGLHQNSDGSFMADSSALQRAGLTGFSTSPVQSEIARANAQLATAQTERDAAIAKLTNFNTSGDPQLQQILNSVGAQWDTRIAEMRSSLNSQVEALKTTGIRLGSRYTGGAGGVTGSLISGAEQHALNEIGKLESQKQAALLEAKNAYDTQAWDRYYKLVSLADQKYQDQLVQVKALQSAQVAQDKAISDAAQKQKDDLYTQVIKPINDTLLAAAKNGAPADVQRAIEDSTSVADAIAAAGSYLQDVPTSGIVGEYLFYKKQAEAAGQVALDFNAYQDLDANRKRSIAAAGVANTSGLNPKQVTIFNSLVDKQNKSPLIAANDRAAILKDVTEELKKDPTNPSLQVSFIYSFIQALDTYQSAVREGEIGLISSTQGLGNKIQNLPDQILKGTPLSASTVNSYTNTANMLTSSIAAAAKKKQDAFQAQARVAGVGDAFDEYLDATGGIQPAAIAAIQSEEQARANIVNYGIQHPEIQQQVLKLAGVPQPSLNGRAYTWAEIGQILGIQ